jgi:hypothetical protein
MCTATALRVGRGGYPLGLLVGTLGLVAADLYAVGVLILFLGGVGVAVLAGEYLIRYVSSRRPPT